MTALLARDIAHFPVSGVLVCRRFLRRLAVDSQGKLSYRHCCQWAMAAFSTNQTQLIRWLIRMAHEHRKPARRLGAWVSNISAGGSFSDPHGDDSLKEVRKVARQHRATG